QMIPSLRSADSRPSFPRKRESNGRVDPRLRGGDDHGSFSSRLGMKRSGLRLGFATLRAGLALTATIALYTTTGTAIAAGKSFLFGYSAGFLSTPFEAIMANLAMASAAKDGLKLLPVANANQDAGKQITDFHNLIAEGAKGIIVVPTDSDAIA